jgi:predicted Zn-dependent protease
MLDLPGFKSLCLSSLLVFLAIPLSAQTPEISRALDRADYARAEKLAATALQTRPRDVSLRLLLARAVLAQGRFREAFTHLRGVIALDPKNVDALYYLGLSAGALSQMEYERLYALAPESYRVHQLMAESALAQDNQEEAENELQAALTLKPDSQELLIALAEIKRTQSKFEEAVPLYQRAAETGGMNYDIAYGLGVCSTYKQEHAKASEHFRMAVKLAPDAPAARFALGNALFQLGQVENAIPELQAAVRLEDSQKQAWFLLGRAYQKLGRQAEAKEAFAKIEAITARELQRDQGISREEEKGKRQKANIKRQK